MKSIREDSIAKISWGILGSMALGLIGGTGYVVSLSKAQEVTAKEVAELKPKVAEVSDIKTDVAVIKEQVSQIKQMIEEDHEK